MGVHGLWKLVEPSGKTVPLESLENKVLAVDVSIWLHQAIKGFQDSKGATVPNAHLLSIYHRICKLLYFRIKPVFVFDGGVPVLKKETIAKRNQLKARNQTEADAIHRNLLNTLLKHTAISKVLSEKTKAAITSPTKISNQQTKAIDSLYFLPPTENEFIMESSSGDEEECSVEETCSKKRWDLHSIDTRSAEFKSLPVELKHEILTDLKETRKQNSWGRINELPTESDDFSIYQMSRLLKRNSVQTALEEVEKEMGGHSLSLGELEKILKEQGVITNNVVGNRIASDENTRFLLIKDVKQAIEEAKKKLESISEENEGEDDEKKDEVKTVIEIEEHDDELKNKADIEFEDDLQKAIALSLQDQPSTSKDLIEEPTTSQEELKEEQFITQNSSISFLGNYTDADFESDSSGTEDFEVKKLTLAQSYMLEYSGLTPAEINRIIASKNTKVANVKKDKQKSKKVENVKIAGNQSKLNKEKIEIKEIIVNNEKISEKIDEVEVMSDSGSGSSDFEEVTDIPMPKAEVKVMEVVIKPVEKLEDDLFSDIFESETPEIDTKNEENINGITKEIEAKDDDISLKKLDDIPKNEDQVSIDNKPNELERVELASKSTEINQTKNPEGLKDKIEKIIQQYSKPKENKNEEMPSTSTEKKETTILSVEQMKEIQQNLEKEERALTSEKSTKERLATNITDQMRQETQELLELFGVPYVIAPMEAESQCAFLEQIQLTDGSITDDSDIWLFGGQTVYKNFFNNNKQVMEFRIENIQHHFKLTRNQMILLAMLVGSDYTTGLQGVGPVTALEILAAFPPRKEILSGLYEFKGWVKKGKNPEPGRTSLRSKLKNLVVTEGFPSGQVLQAYLEPKVETSKEKFSWAKPNIVALVEFAYRKFGWTRKKSEEILNPILKRLDETKLQTSIKDYFKVNHQNGVALMDLSETKLSKRVKTALNKIGRPEEEIEEEEASKTNESSKQAKKSRGKKKVLEENGVAGNSRKKVKTSTGRGKKKDILEEIKPEDCDIEMLEHLQVESAKRVKELENEILEKQKKVQLANLHKREVIPQRQKEKTDMLRNKIKAIEVFRKSKQGPGFVKKNQRKKQQPKQDASYLSEDSD